MTLKLDQRLQQGRYRIRERLGQGGMGTVYLAEDLNLSGRSVAIKENIDVSPEAQEQFKREAVMLASLTHPNLPRVTDHFIEPSGRQYLVMDYVHGEDLREVLQDHGAPLPEQVALDWMGQVMSALEYMHTWVDPVTRRPNPIIHRDIKPGNIKRTPDGRIVLVDFGLARFVEGAVTIMGARAVTPGYSPIEQYTGGTDTRSDIYALGATLYALITGQKPPESPAIAAGTTLPPPRKLNPKLTRTTERVILRAMQIQPAERYSSVQEMRTALFSKRNTNPITDRLATPFAVGTATGATRSPSKRWRRMNVGISAGVLILIVATGSGFALFGAGMFERLLDLNELLTPGAALPLDTAHGGAVTPPDATVGNLSAEANTVQAQSVANNGVSTPTLTMPATVTLLSTQAPTLPTDLTPVPVASPNLTATATALPTTTATPTEPPTMTATPSVTAMPSATATVATPTAAPTATATATVTPPHCQHNCDCPATACHNRGHCGSQRTGHVDSNRAHTDGNANYPTDRHAYPSHSHPATDQHCSAFTNKDGYTGANGNPYSYRHAATDGDSNRYRYHNPTANRHSDHNLYGSANGNP
ncbi:MAG: protein kinase [Caldilineaceae bacterium]